MTNFSGDNESLQQPTQSSLCVKNCGFFANPACMGMCSKCYRDNQQKEEANKKAADNVAEAMEAKTAKTTPVSLLTTPPPVPQTVPEASQPVIVTPVCEPCSSQDPAPPAKTPTRCQECRKKVGLTGFKCRCGMLFCGQHRYAEAHNCTFDYKTVERQRLAENNPLVQASKVQKL